MNARVSVVLSPWQGRGTGDEAMFIVTVRWEYRTTLDSPTLRFACVSEPEDYRDLLDDPSCAIVCHFQPVEGLDGSSPEAFQLLQCTANGRPVPNQRTVQGRGQVVTVDFGEQVVAAGKPVTLSYTFRTLVRRHGHLFHLDISQPTKGLHVDFTYKDCGISSMSVLDYIAGAEQPQINQLPADDPTPSIEIGYEGWVFPKGGVTFVWVLATEVSTRQDLKVMKSAK